MIQKPKTETQREPLIDLIGPTPALRSSFKNISSSLFAKLNLSGTAAGGFGGPGLSLEPPFWFPRIMF